MKNLSSYWNVRSLTFLMIVGFSFFPLLFSFPFRINIFLPFEGALRLYLGQTPYKDFGMPFGTGFLALPTFFFHLFGPSFISLIYAQSLINLISCFAFWGVLQKLKVGEEVSFIGVFVYCVSYVFIHFWPWHTQTAYTYGLVALYFLLASLDSKKAVWSYVLMFASSFFSFYSFFTKQDYGGLNLLFCIVLLAVSFLYDKNWRLPLVFVLGYVLVALLFIGSQPSEFGYWFNHGQPPHSSRLSIGVFFNSIFGSSEWEKLYLLALALVILIKWPTLFQLLKQKEYALLILITAGMIVQAMLTKVTSRMQTGTTTYYHAFAIAFLFYHLQNQLKINNWKNLVIVMLMMGIWWSGMYWNYASRIFKFQDAAMPGVRAKAAPVQAAWELSPFKSLKKIKLPTSTIEGIGRLKALPELAEDKKKVVFNMTELTNLPVELGYEPIKGIPLWYDYGVCIFDEQIKSINEQIESNVYDVFLYEYIPSMEDYYPIVVREKLQKEYRLIDTFLAPRKEEDSQIEVYVRKKP